jgi:hypothetical protein
VQEAAPALGLQIQILNATTIAQTLDLTVSPTLLAQIDEIIE